MFYVGSGQQSIVLAAVNDGQYKLWYNAFQQAKMVSDAAVGKYESSGEMAEYMGVEDFLDDEDGGDEDEEDEDEEEVDEEDEEDPYEKPTDMILKHVCTN